jgi:hypothetical protein
MAETISAENVANAAPLTPKPSPWIRRGSKNIVSILHEYAIITELLTSSVPRKAENPTKEVNMGRKESDLILKYGFAIFKAGAPPVERKQR